jgi:hypothetical protein
MNQWRHPLLLTGPDDKMAEYHAAGCGWLHRYSRYHRCFRGRCSLLLQQQYQGNIIVNTSPGLGALDEP